MVNKKLREKYSGGFLMEVMNPKGKKPNIEIYQGYKSGFSARYSKSGRVLGMTSRNAEAFARRLAKKGHRTVRFLD